MLHFLDNHDEQRLASPNLQEHKGKPLMVVSTTISTSPTMVYFGQEVGEAGNENAGFGTHPEHQSLIILGFQIISWMNGGKFDGGQLTQENLRDFL
jgi:hypothetical protein